MVHGAGVPVAGRSERMNPPGEGEWAGAGGGGEGVASSFSLRWRWGFRIAGENIFGGGRAVLRQPQALRLAGLFRRSLR